MKHDSKHIDGNFSVGGYTDRMAILTAIVLLALLWFLYGKMGANGKHMNNKPMPIVGQVDMEKGRDNIDAKKLKQNIAVEEVVEKDVLEQAVGEEANIKNPIEKVEENAETIPAWYQYLMDNNYAGVVDTVYSDFDGDTVVTRSSSTPYLARYAYVNKLEEKSTVADCTFPDVTSKSDFLQKNIIAACGYDLLRGSNGNFIPDRNMTKDELLTVLVRTKAGYLDETTDPRFQNYFDYGLENGLLDAGTKISDFSGNVTTKELGQRLYKLSLVK